MLHDVLWYRLFFLERRQIIKPQTAEADQHWPAPLRHHDAANIGEQRIGFTTLGTLDPGHSGSPALALNLGTPPPGRAVFKQYANGLARSHRKLLG